MFLSRPILLVLLAKACDTYGFTTVTPATKTSFTVKGSGSTNGPAPLFNVPPKTIDSDPESIKDAASRESPPQSFYQLGVNCVRAAELAIADGNKLIEVEFPPLPAAVLDMDDVSAYDVAAANFNFALDFAKAFAAKSKTVEDGSDGKNKIPTNVAILFPDEAEKNIALENTSTSPNPFPGVQISSIRTSDPRDTRFLKPEQTFLSLFGGKSNGMIQPIEGVEMYIIIIASAQELPDVEELHDLNPDAVICFYNLKLDVLRGDLGAPAFPPKDFQDRFLSRVKPVYYLRTRQYSRSTPNPPFMVNYQGCLFRSYPGEFQTLLDTGTGNYRRVKGNSIRPALGEFKEELTEALRVEGVIGEEGNFLNFLRTGYKTTTWWEEPREGASDSWLT
jgi:hypothetical protein